MNDIAYLSKILCNRIEKRYKHLKKWAKRSGISSFRIYDKDIPEIPLAIDFYEGERINSLKLDEKKAQNTEQPQEQFLVFYLYERKSHVYEKSAQDEATFLKQISLNVASILGVSISNIFLKMRKKQKGLSQYEKNDCEKIEIKIVEQGLFFLINLSDYLDTGLFFDHRPLRAKIKSESRAKTVLNLYCYTASFSLYCAKGEAKCVTSVDISPTYLAWSKKNFLLNGLNPESAEYKFIESDVKKFLIYDKNFYDIIILDPPTFSNSKKTKTFLDINEDWSKLVSLCCAHLTNGGILYFSTNSKHLSLVQEFLPTGFSYKDITEFSIPEDFRNKKIHKCYKIYKK